MGSLFRGYSLGLRDSPLVWFAALRALVAGVCLVLVAEIQSRPRPRGFHAWLLITALGLVNVTVAFAAMFAGVSGLATGTAAVLANAQPLLILLPAWWLYGEAVTVRTAAALAVGFSGLLVVAVPGGGGSGALLSLLSAAAITGGTLLSRRLAGLDVLSASGWHFVIGGVVLAVWAAMVEGPPVIDWTPPVRCGIGVSVVGGYGRRIRGLVHRNQALPAGRAERVDILGAGCRNYPGILTLWRMAYGMVRGGFARRTGVDVDRFTATSGAFGNVTRLAVSQ